MPEQEEKTFGEMLSRREVATRLERAQSLIKKLEEAAADPEIRSGAEATLRTLINAAIAVADTFPAMGVGSLSADAAKAWARYQHSQEKGRVQAQGGDPSKVQMSRLDLTPDVSLRVAAGTELIELLAVGFLPTHIVESSMQLRRDWPRIKKAFERVRAILSEQAEVKPQTIEAAEAFDVDLSFEEETTQPA